MKEKKYHIYLNDEEYNHIFCSLVELKNELVYKGKYTDAVDDVLCKLTKAKKNKMKIKYI